MSEESSSFVRFLRPGGRPVRKNARSIVSYLMSGLVLVLSDGEEHLKYTVLWLSHRSFRLNSYRIGKVFTRVLKRVTKASMDISALWIACLKTCRAKAIFLRGLKCSFSSIYVCSIVCGFFGTPCISCIYF